MVAYYCLLKFHMTPSEFLEKPRRERAFIIAAIKCWLESEKRAAEELERR